ncbi:FecR domain-containing protein [Rhodopseudomonas sp. AAP120]|uniref:FecR family protein n=1 Tax=Rhodopseudomonas sp. AAP120 TaxID=1523430 RepID=UPI0006B8F147|nr:FecR domain-containing protein [Rhodopseudomonas sp. AAP120]
MTKSEGGHGPAVGDAHPTGTGMTEPDPLDREAHDWIARGVAGEMARADLVQMREWYGRSPAHAAAYARARRMWRLLGPALEAPGPADRRQATVPGRPARPTAMGRRAFLGGLAAASAAAVGAVAVINPPLDLWPSYAELTADYHTGRGEQRKVALGDDVALVLNTSTSVAVRAQTPDENRIELISGETLITASGKSAQLTVVARDGLVMARQADFNLSCVDGAVRVSCLAGEVRVDYRGTLSSVRAGSQLGYARDVVDHVAEADLEIVTAWRHGLMIFDATPVAQVVAEVNRYRPGRIVLINDAIAARRLSARLRIDEADKIVNQLVHIFGARATSLPGGLVILT